MRPPLDDGALRGGSPIDALGAAADAKRLEQWKATKDAGREERYVLQIVRGLGLTASRNAFRYHARENMGIERLNLAWMCTSLMGWPLWLTATWSAYTWRTFVPKWFSGFTTTGIYQGYVTATELKPTGWDGGCGVIFSLANIKGAYGAMVLHDSTVPLQEGKTMMLHRIRGRDLVVERLQDLLERLDGSVSLTW